MMAARKTRLGALYCAARRARLGRGRSPDVGRAGVGVVAGLMAFFVVQMPRVAAACSVCSAGRDEENAAAFLISTIFMSLLPLIAIGSIGYLIFRRIREFEAEKEARRVASAAASSAEAGVVELA